MAPRPLTVRLLCLAAPFGVVLIPTTGTVAHATHAVRLSGSVVDADSGAPVARARIVAFLSFSIYEPSVSETDDRGQYTLTMPEAGAYTVKASKAGYVTSTYGRLHDFDSDFRVDVRAGEEHEPVDFQLTREAIVTGQIVSADGRGVPGMFVSASRPHRTSSAPIPGQSLPLRAFGTARTDAAGHYEISGLPPGEYYISVRRFDAADSRALQYAPTYYPGTVIASQSGRVSLKAGTPVHLAPMTPLDVPYSTFRGRLQSADGQPPFNAGVTLEPLGGDGLRFSPDAQIRVQPTGRFAIYFVAPGVYTVRARGQIRYNTPTLFATWTAYAEGKTLPEATVVLKSAATISGIVRIDGRGAAQANEWGLRVSAPLVGGLPGALSADALIEPDGRFVLTGVEPGRRWLRIEDLPAPWSLDRVTLGSADVTDAGIAIGERPPYLFADVVLTDAVTGVSGTVMSARNTPARNQLVVIFPADRTLWRRLSRRIVAARTEADGRFQLQLPPGDYKAAVATDIDDDEIFDAAILDRLDARAVRVTLTRGHIQAMTLRVPGAGIEPARGF